MKNDELAPYMSAIPFSAIELQTALVNSCLEYYSLEVLQPIHSLIQNFIDSVWPQPARFHLVPFFAFPMAVSQENKCARREYLKGMVETF